MANKFRIGYLPLSKVNWTNDTLEAARADAIRFLNTLPDVEVLAPARRHQLVPTRLRAVAEGVRRRLPRGA